MSIDVFRSPGGGSAPTSAQVRDAGRWEQIVTVIANPTDRFTATATKTIANTVTETSLFGTGEGTLTFPADFFVAGASMLVTMRGQLSDTGTPDFTIRSKLDSTVIASEGPTALIGVSAAEWQLSLMLTCRSAGASGAFSTGGEFSYNGSGSVYVYSDTEVTVDTTQPLTLDVTWQWGTADAADTIITQEAVVATHSPNQVLSDRLQPVTNETLDDVIYGWVVD